MNAGDNVPPCKVNYDPTQAKDMLLMAASPEEQQKWVTRLLKRIQKSGYKASATLAANSAETSSLGGTNGSGSRISPQESMRSTYKGQIQSKTASLPGHNKK